MSPLEEGVDERMSAMDEMKYLYGSSTDDEILYRSPEDVYSNMMGDRGDLRDVIGFYGQPGGEAIMRVPFEIIEWTARPLATLLPSADTLLDRIVEWWIDDECGWTEARDVAVEASTDGAVVLAFESALEQYGKAMGDKWLTADLEHRRLNVTWDEDGQPLLDGRPMYVKRQEIPGQEALDV